MQNLEVEVTTMGRTFPNLDAERVTQAGYYFSPRLLKLARLHVGAKLPVRGGPWEFVIGDGAMSSSEVVHRLRREYPDLNWKRFTYTVKSPLGRRIPLGVAPRQRILQALALSALCVTAGWLLGRIRS
jgi:hypothetical protein